MSFIIECYEEIKFYDYLLFDTVFLHRVNFMPVQLYNDEFYYYQYDTSILLTTNKLRNDNCVPGVLDLKTYIHFISKRIKLQSFNINIDGYHHPITDIEFINVSRKYKLAKIKKLI